MQISPQRLRFLLAIARTGGVLAAADELDVTASAVSQQLARLEQEVGAPLVQRTTHGAVLTEAGRTIADAAEEVERAINLARARLQHPAKGVQGTVRIGSFHSFLNAVLIPQLPAWQGAQPGISYQVSEADRDSLLKQLRSGELDVIILELDADEKAAPLVGAMIEVPLLDDPWQLILPVGTFHGTELVDLDRLDLPWLGVDDSAASAHAVRRIRRATRAPEATVHTYLDTQTALALVAARQGVTILPSLALHGADLTGVEALDLPGLGARRVVMRRYDRRGVSEAVRLAGSLIREAAGAE